jgi:hypothetical protein
LQSETWRIRVKDVVRFSDGESIQPTMSYLKELGWVGEESELARSLIFLKFRPQSVLGRKMRAVVYDGGGDTTMIHSAG